MTDPNDRWLVAQSFQLVPPRVLDDVRSCRYCGALIIDSYPDTNEFWIGHLKKEHGDIL